MALSEEEITRLYRVRRTVMQMLKDGEYLVTESDINMTKEQFRSTYGENMKREDLDINKEKRSDSSDQIYVFFPNEAKVGVNTMRDYTKRMQSQNVFRAILVSQTKLTPFATRCISEMSTRFQMEVFQVNFICLNCQNEL
ncbi:hypothetical protein ACLB2K_045004 [Fragaria x ananassa]